MERMDEYQFEWLEDAACKGLNPDMFYPDKGTNYDMALLVCSQCVVRIPCLEYALEHREKGVWSGTTEKERRLIRKSGMSAEFYLNGIANGSITKPKKGRPISVKGSNNI